ncbi:hypothetical protein BH10BAC2_BH10BAC2_07260 [soil metagenome]
MKLPQLKKIVIGLFIIACFLLPAFSFAQCMFRPIAMSEKITKSEFAVLGKVLEQHSYMDNNGNIFTLNKINITAWLKNHRANTKDIFVITTGGVVGNKAQITEPALQLRSGQEYFLMLQKDSQVDDDKNLRVANPSKIQAYVYADAQGALLLSNDKYHDISNSEEFSEETLLQRIYTHTKQTAKRPDGSLFVPRKNNSVVNSAVLAVSIATMSPNPAIAGTINTADFLLITGTGFGTDTGIVSFKNADDGGLTYITPPNASDYTKWKDDSIIVKIPSNAGTGRIKVNGVISTPVLTINYAHTSINSSFSGFASATRQRYYLRDKNGTGGYTFKYNTNSGFSTNTLAKNAFKRAANKWKCNTGVNWEPFGTTTKTFANDDFNVVLFDAALPAGVLARATSRFTGGSTGSCDNANTVWYLEEIDIQFQSVPSAGYTWQYGPATPTSTQYDFESVALHELGHAHGLGHRIAAGKVMHYSIPNGVSRRVPAAQEITGGLAKMAYSTVATCFNPAGSGTPMITAACPTFQLAGVAEDYKTVQDPSLKKLQVYPNPVADLLYINAPRNSELRLTNTEGSTVKIIMVKAGINKIYLNNISNGIYYVQGKPGEEKVKIVVMH